MRPRPNLIRLAQALGDYPIDSGEPLFPKSPYRARCRICARDRLTPMASTSQRPVRWTYTNGRTWSLWIYRSGSDTSRFRSTIDLVQILAEGEGVEI